MSEPPQPLTAEVAEATEAAEAAEMEADDPGPAPSAASESPGERAPAVSGAARSTFEMMMSDLRTATPVLKQFLSDVKMLLLSLFSFLYWKSQALWIEFGPQVEVFLFKTVNITRAKASQVQETVQTRLREAQVDDIINKKASSMKKWLNEQRKEKPG